MRPTLLVLAAGMGSRYGGVKQIEAVGPGGQIILEYSVFDAIRAGFGRVVFVIRRDIEHDFVSSIMTRFSGKIDASYVFQDLDALPGGFSVPPGRTKPWGTGHAILVAEKQVREPFAVINADDFYGADAFTVIGGELSRGEAGGLSGSRVGGEPASYCMVAYRLANTVSDFGSVSRGICEVDADGYLKNVVEHTAISKIPGGGLESRLADGTTVAMSGNETVSMNLFGFTPDIFGRLREQLTDFLREKGTDLKAELYIPSAVTTTIRRGQARLRVLHSDAQWFGITYREDLPEVKASIAALHGKGLYPDRLWD